MSSRAMIAGLCVLCIAAAVWLVRSAHGPQVVARLGGPPSVAMYPPQTADKIRLGPSTRTAIRAALSESFEVDIDPTTALLTFSIGVRAPAPDGASAAAGESTPVMNEETRERLRALGYLH